MPRSSARSTELLAQAELLILPFLAPRAFAPWPTAFRTQKRRACSRPHANRHTAAEAQRRIVGREFDARHICLPYTKSSSGVQNTTSFSTKTLPCISTKSLGLRRIHGDAMAVAELDRSPDLEKTMEESGRHADRSRKARVARLLKDFENIAQGQEAIASIVSDYRESLFMELEDESAESTVQLSSEESQDWEPISEQVLDTISQPVEKNGGDIAQGLFQEESLDEATQHAMNVLSRIKLENTGPENEIVDLQWLTDEWHRHEATYAGTSWISGATAYANKSPQVAVEFCSTLKPSDSITNGQLRQLASVLAGAAVKDLRSSTFATKVFDLLTSWILDRGVFVAEESIRHLIRITRMEFKGRPLLLKLYNMLSGDASYWTQAPMDTRFRIAAGLAFPENKGPCLDLLASFYLEATSTNALFNFLAQPKQVSTVITPEEPVTEAAVEIGSQRTGNSVLCAILFKLFKQLNKERTAFDWQSFENLLQEHQIHLPAISKQQMSFNFARNGRTEECLSLLEQAIQEGFPSNSVQVQRTCTVLVSRAASMRSNYLDATSLIKRVLSLGAETDVIMFNIVAQKAIESGDPDTAWRILEIIRAEDSVVQPNAHSHTLMLQSARLLNNKEHLRLARNLLQEFDLGPDTELHPALIAEFLRSVLSSGSWNRQGWANVVAEYSKFYKLDPLAKLGLVDDIHSRGVEAHLPLPSAETFRLMLKQGLRHTPYDRMWNIYRLFRGYAEAGYSPFVEYAAHSSFYADFIELLMTTKQISGKKYSRIWHDILKDMARPVHIPEEGKQIPALAFDPLIAKVVMRSYGVNMEPHGAEGALAIMEKCGFKPNVGHYWSLIWCWCRAQNPAMVAKTIWRMEKDGIKPNKQIMGTINEVLDDKKALESMLLGMKAGELPWKAEDEANSKKLNANRKKLKVHRGRMRTYWPLSNPPPLKTRWSTFVGRDDEEQPRKIP